MNIGLSEGSPGVPLSKIAVIQGILILSFFTQLFTLPSKFIDQNSRDAPISVTIVVCFLTGVPAVRRSRSGGDA